MSLKWLAVLKQIGPVVLALTPAAPMAPFVLAGIDAAEHLKGASGPEKLAHAKAITQAAVAAVNAQHGSPVIDPDLADAVYDDAVSTTIGVCNLVHRQPPA